MTIDDQRAELLDLLAQLQRITHEILHVFERTAALTEKRSKQ